VIDPRNLPDDYLLFILLPTEERWVGQCPFFEGFQITLGFAPSADHSGLTMDRLMALIRANQLKGELLYPNGKITPITFEIVHHRGKDEVYMKSSLGYFIWEYASVTSQQIAFAFYFWYTPPATQTDLAALQQAEQLLETPSNWHQQDDRKCEDDLATHRWSLFCALKHASIDQAGEYNHHNTAIQYVRFVIDERVPDHGFAHTLMDYNNAPTTTHRDILRCIALAKKRIQEDLAAAR
jgi:hypothetical protein